MNTPKKRLSLTMGALALMSAANAVAHAEATIAVSAGAREVSAPADRPIDIAVTLPLSHQDQLNKFISDVNDPTSPVFGKYLTPQQFAAEYGASQADQDAVVKDLQSRGFTVGSHSPTRSFIQVSAPASIVEKTFHVHLNEYIAKNGRRFHSPDAPETLPATLSARGAQVVGLDTSATPHSTAITPSGTNSFGFNEDNGAGPGQIRFAYGLPNSGTLGTGQNIGLLELDDYDDNDVTGYEQTFNLPATPIVRDQIAATTLGAGQSQVTTDIDALLAVAPNASHIVVYETPLAGGTAGILTALQAMANDTTYRCREFSYSWTMGEDVATSNFSSNTFVNAENQVFTQMAAQGQAFFCASGNTGAYGDPASPGSTMPTDPAAQPLVTSVGGTTITVGSDDLYTSETTWGDPTNQTLSSSGIGSGGGFSQVWPFPAYQQGVVSHAPAGEYSTTHRNFPDVSLAADGTTGYAVYVQGGFQELGGTGPASAIWCGFWALANQQRAALAEPQLGFANPYLYRLGKSSHYAADFHDIADNSTNLLYHAVTGYDVATGWGTINSGLMTDLVTNQAGGAPNLLVLQNSSTHQLQLWQTSNTGMISSSTISLIPAASLKVVGVGVYNLPGSYDIVFQDQSTNAITIWHMSGSTAVAINTLTQTISSAWKAVGVGDFNGDGTPDILFQNTSTRQLAYWQMNGYVITGVTITTTPPSGWTVAGTGDFNGDGNSDILIVNTVQRMLAVWHMNGPTVLSGVYVATAYGSGYNVAAISNLQGYANPDIIFESGTHLAVWDMNDAIRTGGVGMTSTVPTGWTVVGPK